MPMIPFMQVMLANDFSDAVDPVGWWMSEKLDGVRAYWTGSQLLTRTGRVIPAPAWFTAGLPAFALDGELYLGRRRFQQISSIVRGSVRDERWPKVRFVVFDAPDVAGGFEDRLVVASAHFAAQPHPYARVLEQTRCESQSHLRATLACVVKAKGEGLVLRRSGSAYDRRRSGDMLKLKTLNDIDATVTGYQPGRGQFAGAVGALVATLDSGRTFEVGSGLTRADRFAPPPVGSRICVAFNGWTDARLPRNPVYAGVRAD